MIKSSLSDDDLRTPMEARLLADRAAHRAIEELKVPDEDYFKAMWSSKHNRELAADSIAIYLNDLKNGDI